MLFAFPENREEITHTLYMVTDGRIKHVFPGIDEANGKRIMAGLHAKIAISDIMRVVKDNEKK